MVTYLFQASSTLLRTSLAKSESLQASKYALRTRSNPLMIKSNKFFAELKLIYRTKINNNNNKKTEPSFPKIYLIDHKEMWEIIFYPDQDGSYRTI